jgi:hypothetical protein
MHIGGHLGLHIGEQIGSVGATPVVFDAQPKGVRLVHTATDVAIAAAPVVLVQRNAISVTITEVSHG